MGGMATARYEVLMCDRIATAEGSNNDDRRIVRVPTMMVNGGFGGVCCFFA